MPRSKRDVEAVAEETISLPHHLIGTQSMARVQQAAVTNLYQLELATGGVVLAGLSARLRPTIRMYDHAALADRFNKLYGEIVNVVRGEKAWRTMPYWPPKLSDKRATYEDDSDDEVPNMPASDLE